jgi:hypothetical protein
MGEVLSACFERNRHDVKRTQRQPSFESLDEPIEKPRLSQRELRARMISQQQARKGASVCDMVIHEDTILEALCERTNIEPRTSVKHREISVTKKERRKLFNKFASSTDMEDLFRDEDKMKAFIITQTGYSDRDNEINDEIEQLSKRLCRQSRSSVTNGDTGGGGRTSRTSRTSINSRNSNQSMTLLGQRMSRTSFNSVMRILNEHREKVKSGEHMQQQQAAENMAQQRNRPNRIEVRQSNIIEEVTFEDSKVNNENWRIS